MADKVLCIVKSSGVFICRLFRRRWKAGVAAIVLAPALYAFCWPYRQADALQLIGVRGVMIAEDDGWFAHLGHYVWNDPKSNPLARQFQDQHMISAINRVAHLRTLNTGRFMTDRQFAGLTNLQEVRRLVVDCSDVGDASMAKIAALPQLEELYLGGSASQSSLGELSRASRLKRLHAIIDSEEPLPGQAIAALRSLERLQALTLEQSTLNDKILTDMMPLARLVDLNIGVTHITDRGLDCLAGCENLEILNVCSDEVTGNSPAFGQLKNLRALTAKASKIDDRGLESICQCESLEVLDLTHTKVTDAGTLHLKKLVHLKQLSLSDNRKRITNETVEHIFGLPALEVLNLSVTQIDDRGLVQLAAMPKLRMLSVDATAVTKAALAEFVDARPDVIFINPVQIFDYPFDWDPSDDRGSLSCNALAVPLPPPQPAGTRPAQNELPSSM